MSDHKQSMQRPEDVATFGLLAEYEDQDKLIAAAKAVRDQGFTRWDSYSPYPVHGIDPAMGIKPTHLPWFVLGAGLVGLTIAVVFQWWANAVDYAWIVSGKPFWSIPANVPIAFELTILFSAITTFVSMLVLNGLPKPSHPLDRVRRFARVTDDRFFLLIEAADAKFDEVATRRLLDGTQPVAVELVPEDTSSAEIPRGLIYGGIILATVALIPFGLFTQARHSTSTKPPFHIVPNMDFQQKHKAQSASAFFADGRAMRLPVEGTVAVGELREDTHFYQGKVDEQWATIFPEQIEISEATMERGAERYGIFCAPCHGETGDGDGMVHRRAFALMEGTWVKPTNIAEPQIQQQPVGQLFNTISNGIRNMPPYASQIPPEDRWAIVLYLRALQRSQAELAANLDGNAPAETGN